MLLSLPQKNGETATKFNLMKSIYLKEASAEKLRPTHEKGYIQRMQNLAEKDEPFTLAVFQNTGRIMTRFDYEKDQGNFCGHEIQEDTKSIILYINCTIIECNFDGIWTLQLGSDLFSSADVVAMEIKLHKWLSKELKVQN